MQRRKFQRLGGTLAKLFVCASWLFSLPHSAKAQAVDWPTLGFSAVTSNSFSGPTCIAHAGDNSGRLFIVQQAGQIRIIETNVVTGFFLTISDRVLSTGGEQGLLGLAFSPGFSTNGHFYVDYTRKTDGAIVISRFSLTGDPNVADPNSEQIIKVISKPFNNHNGGQLAFGPDGDLYIGVGDGGSEGDPQNMGQKTNVLLGKILRIDVESGVSPYAVPTNNPFVGVAGYQPEIWAFGLRNPWRFSFDRLTGDLYIGDVGQNVFEEIDFQPTGSPGGQNYGWRIAEGPTNYNVPAGFTNFAAFTPPVAWYDHRILPTDLAGSVTGGYIYRGPSQPRMDGIYFYGDFMSGWIWGLKHSGTNWLSPALVAPASKPGTPPAAHFSISTFGEDDDGNLYLADYSAGRIYQITDSRQVCTPTFAAAGGTLNSNFVTVSCLSTGAVIHYTTNGVDPVETDSTIASGGQLFVTTATTNKLRAYRADLTPSAVASAIFTNRVATPVFSWPTGPVTNGTAVAISTVTPGASIYYALNNTNPTTNSFLYTGPLIITSNVIIKAMGVAPGCSNSIIYTVGYTLAQAAIPLFSPSAGPITNGTAISMSCATSNAVIYYTLDGSPPTTNSAVYSTPLTINGGTTVNAIAVVPTYLNSPVQSVLYSLVQTVTPVFNPASGPITNGTQIVITSDTPGATIYYTLDGSTPTTSSPVYNGPLVPDMTNGGIILSAFATADEHLDSVVQTTPYRLVSWERTVVTTFAGHPGAGFSNAFGANAQFNAPQGICIDRQGNLYVADSSNNRVRKITPAGEVTTFAGTGVDGTPTGGQATNAQISFPTGVGCDDSGNVYVAEGHHIDKIDTNGIITVLASVSTIWQLASDPVGNIYFGGWVGVQKVATNGTITSLGGPGAGYAGKVAPCVDSQTNVYAATSDFVWHISPDGTLDLFAGGTSGISDGPGTNAWFTAATDAVLDSAHNIFVADDWRIRKIRPDGWVSTLAGVYVGYQNGPGEVARFYAAEGVCVDTNGNVYVADSGNSCIRKISPDTAGIGIADDWQRAHFGSVGIDPNADPDHDGMSNFAEFWADTDPLDANSVLAINGTSVVINGTVNISWQSVAGKSYVVRYSTDLRTWKDLKNPIDGDGSILTITDSLPPAQNEQRFYRIFLSGL